VCIQMYLRTLTGPLMSGATNVHTYMCMREREGVYRGVCVCIQMYLRTLNGPLVSGATYVHTCRCMR